jgi:hypothetical protein
MLVVAFGKQWEEHKFSSGFPSLKPVWSLLTTLKLGCTSMSKKGLKWGLSKEICPQKQKNHYSWICKGIGNFILISLENFERWSERDPEYLSEIITYNKMWVEIKGSNFNYHVIVFQAKLWDAFIEFQITYWIAWISPYRAVNSFHHGYKNRSANDVYSKSHCLFWDPYKTLNTKQAPCRIFEC